MAGLNSLVTDTATKATTLPSWYSTAQQNVVNQAANVNAPGVEQTVAPSTLASAFGPSGTFSQSANTLQQIASGAANPWLVSGTGEISPNVNTALGGLFKAQTDYANKMMPDVEAAATAPYIGTGGFGSRMNIGAAEKAKGQFLSDLFQKQMTSALQSQQTGATAGLSAAETANKAVQDAITAATYQQNAPYAAPTNVASIIGKLGQQPTTVTSTDKLGGLNQIMGLLNAAQGMGTSLTGGYIKDASGNLVKTPGLLDQFGIKGGLTGLWNKITGNTAPGVNVDGTTAPPSFESVNGGTYDPESGMTWYQGADQQGYGIDASGNYFDASGNLIWSPSWSDTSGGLNDINTNLDIYGTSEGE